MSRKSNRNLSTPENVAADIEALLFGPAARNAEANIKIYQKHSLWNYTLSVDGVVRNGNIGFQSQYDAEQDALRRAQRYSPKHIVISIKE